MFQALQGLFGSQVVGQFSQFSRVWFVILQADAEYRARPEDFNQIYLRAASGANVPLSSLITTRYVASPKLVTRFNGFPAVKVTGHPAPGYSSGEAIRAMEEVARHAAGRLRLLVGGAGAAGEGSRAALRRRRSSSAWSSCSCCSPRSSRSGRCRSRWC